MFQCAPLSLRLSRLACARNHERARRPTNEIDRIRLKTCAACEVGSAHASGQRPVVELVQLRQREPSNEGAKQEDPKEQTMADPILKHPVERECRGCKKKFVAKHGPQRYCTECRPPTKANGRAKRKPNGPPSPKKGHAGPSISATLTAAEALDLLELAGAEVLFRRPTPKGVLVLLGGGS
jgi:hypothetical protein